MNCTRQAVKLIKDHHRGSYEQGVGIQASLDQNIVLSESMSYRIDQILANTADARAENRNLRERVNRMSNYLRSLMSFVATNGMIAFPIMNRLLRAQGNVELDMTSMNALADLARQSEEDLIPVFTAPIEPINASLSESRARLRAAEMTAAAQAQLEIFPKRATELNERDPNYAFYLTAARRGSEFTADDEQFYQEEARIAEAEFRNDPADQVIIKRPKPGTRSQKKDAVNDTFNPHIKRITRYEAQNLTSEQLAELVTEEPETEPMDDDVSPPKRKRNRSRSASKSRSKSGAKQQSKQTAKAKAEEAARKKAEEAAKKRAAEEAARAAEAQAEAERKEAEAARIREAKNRKIMEAKAKLAAAQAELDAAESHEEADVLQVDDDYATTHEVDKSSRQQPRGSSSDFETPRRVITNVSNAPLMMTRDLTARNAPLRSRQPQKSKPVVVRLRKGQTQTSRAKTPAQDRLNKFKQEALSSQATSSTSVLRDRANYPSRKARTVQSMMKELTKHRNARKGIEIKQSHSNQDDDDADSVTSTGSQKRKRELSEQRHQKKQRFSRTVEVESNVPENDLRRKCSQQNPRYSNAARDAIRVKVLKDDSDGEADENENPEAESPDHYEDEDGYWVPDNQQNQPEEQDGDGLDEDLEEIEQNQAVDLND